MSWLENQDSRGATRIWTGGRGVADLCLTTWLWHHIQLLFISILSFLGFVNPFFFSQQSAFVQKKKPRLSTEACEAPPGFEPGIEVLQTFALPLGYGTILFNSSPKRMTPRGFEPLLPPWKGGVLTAWPWSLIKSGFMLRLNSPCWTRTNDTSVNSRMLYRLS